MKPHLTTALSAVAMLALVPPVGAQDNGGGNQSDAQSAEASQCMQDLQQLAGSMQEDGYWLSGYRGYGTVGVMSPSAARGTAPVEPQPEQPTGQLRVQPEAGDTTQDVPAAGPWGRVNWGQPPQFEIGILYRAAYVLAQNGDEQTCQTLLNATQERYNNYVAELEELGVQPQDITNWRQIAVAAAEPVTEMQGRFQVEDIIGSDVRNVEDADLGSIEDVLLDPESGTIRYVVIDHGGFLGIGGQDVVVPWELLRVTTRMNAFVLPVQEAALEQAPSISDEALIDTQQTGSINTDDVDTYWSEVGEGQQ